MALRVTFAEQSTGIVTLTSGERSLGSESFQRVDDMREALNISRQYLEQHPDHEVWIGSSMSSHRVTLPAAQTFGDWLELYQRERTVGLVRLGMTYGEIVTCLGWPDDCGVQFRRSPMAVILRYQPKNVDFHFDDGGRLYLVHQDALDNPLTILSL